MIHWMEANTNELSPSSFDDTCDGVKKKSDFFVASNDTCKHLFHHSCLESWIIQHASKVSRPDCPLCKTDVTTITVYNGSGQMIRQRNAHKICERHRKNQPPPDEEYYVFDYSTRGVQILTPPQWLAWQRTSHLANSAGRYLVVFFILTSLNTAELWQPITDFACLGLGLVLNSLLPCLPFEAGLQPLEEETLLDLSNTIVPLIVALEIFISVGLTLTATQTHRRRMARAGEVISHVVAIASMSIGRTFTRLLRCMFMHAFADRVSAFTASVYEDALCPESSFALPTTPPIVRRAITVQEAPANVRGDTETETDTANLQVSSENSIIDDEAEAFSSDEEESNQQQEQEAANGDATGDVPCTPPSPVLAPPPASRRTQSHPTSPVNSASRPASKGLKLVRMLANCCLIGLIVYVSCMMGKLSAGIRPSLTSALRGANHNYHALDHSSLTHAAVASLSPASPPLFALKTPALNWCGPPLFPRACATLAKATPSLPTVKARAAPKKQTVLHDVL